MNTYEAVLDALGDRTRRQIVEHLRRGPSSVGELAAGLPVSRPAVSQHLTVLRRSGLVRYEERGTRNIYRPDPVALASLRGWLDSFWQTALDSYAPRSGRTAPVEMKGPITTSGRNPMPDHAATFIEAVRKSVTVPASPDRAFELFTARFGDWWPIATHSVGTDRAAGVSFGAGIGGIIVETLADGTTSVWGTVTSWDPPSRVAFSWHAGTPKPEAGLVK